VHVGINGACGNNSFTYLQSYTCSFDGANTSKRMAPQWHPPTCFTNVSALIDMVILQQKTIPSISTTNVFLVLQIKKTLIHTYLIVASKQPHLIFTFKGLKNCIQFCVRYKAEPFHNILLHGEKTVCNSNRFVLQVRPKLYLLFRFARLWYNKEGLHQCHAKQHRFVSTETAFLRWISHIERRNSSPLKMSPHCVNKIPVKHCIL